ncbi:MAG: O-antigen ligase family protein, partial [Aquihabitans sp.]
VRLLAAVAHHDANGAQYAVVLAAATMVAYSMATRPRLHGHLTIGYLAGLSLSVVVALMQALHVPTLRQGNTQGERYPGLSIYAALLTWQIVIGLLLLWFMITTGRKRRTRTWWVAVVLLLLHGLALVTNGAQGGLLALAVVLVAFGWFSRSRISVASLRRWSLALAALVAITVAVVVVSGIEIPTVTDFGSNNFRNERARVEVISHGIDEFRAHPLTGMSRAVFIREHGIAPHFLPLDSAAMAGVLALALSVYFFGLLVAAVWRGPADERPETMVGYLVMAALMTNSLTDSYGPFVGVSRAVPLWIALVAARGCWASTATSSERDLDRNGDGDGRWLWTWIRARGAPGPAIPVDPDNATTSR